MINNGFYQIYILKLLLPKNKAVKKTTFFNFNHIIFYLYSSEKS